MFFYEYNQVLLWQVSSKTTSLKVNGLVHNGLIKDLFPALLKGVLKIYKRF